LFPKKHNRDIWKKILSEASFSEVNSFITVKDVAIWYIVNSPKSLINPNECWTYDRVRLVVRAAIANIIELENFKDDDDFVKDLGLG
jgi:hypothetical protein